MSWLVHLLDVWCFIIDPILWLIGKKRKRAREDRQRAAEQSQSKSA
jgi:hypothetical protein